MIINDKVEEWSVAYVPLGVTSQAQVQITSNMIFMSSAGYA